MRKVQSIAGVLGALFVLVLLNTHSVVAQSTIFNIPSTDVVAPKKVYLELDHISHLERYRKGGFQTFVPRAVFGVAKGLEVGVNVAVTDIGVGDPVTNSGSYEAVEIQPNIKWQFYANEDNGVAASAGGILYVPARDREFFGNDNFGLLYTVVSKKVKGSYGPRLTGGAYGLAGRPDGTGTQGGAIVGYEQPLHPRVSFVADWLSGKNRFGYVTPGLSFALPKSSLLNVGYSIGNQGRKNNGLFVYYGITF